MDVDQRAEKCFGTPRAISLYLVCSERRKSEEEEDKSFSSVVCSFLGFGVRSFVEARPPGIASWADLDPKRPQIFDQGQGGVPGAVWRSSVE